MKIITTRVHGILDYMLGILLLAMPTILGLDHSVAESIIFYVIGTMALIQSLMTDYELSAVKIIPMRIHLMVDCMSGILLAGSPWLFGFADRIYLPHLILGLLEIGAVLMTETRGRHGNMLDR